MIIRHLRNGVTCIWNGKDEENLLTFERRIGPWTPGQRRVHPTVVLSPEEVKEIANESAAVDALQHIADEDFAGLESASRYARTTLDAMRPTTSKKVYIVWDQDRGEKGEPAELLDVFSSQESAEAWVASSENWSTDTSIEEREVKR